MFQAEPLPNLFGTDMILVLIIGLVLDFNNGVILQWFARTVKNTTYTTLAVAYTTWYVVITQRQADAPDEFKCTVVAGASNLTRVHAISNSTVGNTFLFFCIGY